MPRRPRTHLGNGIFHVTARGNRRQEIFGCERDFTHYLALLERVVERFEWRCGAFVLMPNHVHLLVECENGALSAGMQRLQGMYAQWFNGVYRVDGHLFQDRFRAWVPEDEAHFFHEVRYIPLNPVRAHLCADPADWPWSSFRATAGLASAPAFLDVDWILQRLSADREAARRAYAAFVRLGMSACPGTVAEDLLQVRAEVAHVRAAAA